MELDQELKHIFEVRNKLLACQNLNDVSQIALNIIRCQLQSQTAAIFLISKEGLLERYYIIGEDKDGTEITNDWFKDERYQPGASFTGQVLSTKPGYCFGDPTRSVDLDKDEIDERSRRTYKEKLGLLKSAISVPLNGQNRTFGAIEVINKLGGNGETQTYKDEVGVFTSEDAYWLSLVGMNLATAITNLRRKKELETLSEISRILVEPVDPDLNPRPVYQEMVDKLINPLSMYKACILRIIKNSEALEIMAKSSEEVNWDFRFDEARIESETLPGKVFATGLPIIIEDIQQRRGEFKNIAWIEANHLKSYGCFPLKMKDGVVGTLSLFMGFHYEFFESDKSFLNNITYLIAAFSRNVSNTKALTALEDSIADQKAAIMSSGRGVAFNRKIEDVMHEYINELFDLQRALEVSEKSSPGDRSQIIQGKISWVKSRIESIKAEFGKTSYVPVNINHVVRQIVKIFGPEQKRGRISFNYELDPQVPSIMATEDEIRAVVFNPVSNAVKAIRNAGRKRGEVNISTSIINESGISYIQLTVEDNGPGIKKEDQEKIYQRGVTSHTDGTGMGLYILSNIVVSYGGRINLISSVGKGTTFFIKIPIKRNQPGK